MTTARVSSDTWRIHDLVVGILGGGGLGAVVGAFFVARVAGGAIAMLVGVVIGAIIGVLMLMRSHAHSDGFWTPTVVVMWLVGLGSGAFLYLLYDAIKNFE